MKPLTYTLTADDLLMSIIAPVGVGEARSFCNAFGKDFNQVDVPALWDTGATNSCISRRLVRHLGLTFIDLCDVEGVHGIEPAKVYLVDILLPNTVSINNVHAAEFFDNDDFEVIIGMDIITKGDLAMSNSGGKTVVSFRIPPGKPPIDFSREDGRVY